MLPSTLVERVELIFKELGGLLAAAELFTDNELVDISLFNGYTYLIFPFYSPAPGVLTNNLDSYCYLDLMEAGYKPGTSYSVLDRYHKPLYKSKPLAVVENNETQYLFGYSDSDKEFLKSTKHGGLYYLLYENQREHSLLQLVVSHKLPESVIQLNAKNWKRKQEEQHLTIRESNELLLSIPNPVSSLIIAKLEGRLQDNYGETQIFYSSRAELVPAGTKDQLYLMFDKSVWLSFRDYSSCVVEDEVHNLVGSEVEEANTTLIGLGYLGIADKSAVNQYLDYFYIKLAGAQTIEVTITVSKDYEVIGVGAQAYKQLKIHNKVGSRTHAVKQFDSGAVYVQANASELTLSGSTVETTRAGMSFLTQESFKIVATLS